MARLEQVTALVVAAGLAIVSYWLFFSWAGGGQGSRRPALGSPEAPESRPRDPAGAPAAAPLRVPPGP